MRLADKITIARLSLLPLVWVFALLDYKILFTSLLLIGVLGDAIDGYIARKTGGETKLGARLDSYTDFLFAFSIIILFWLFMPEIILENKTLILVLLTLILIPFILSLIIFKKLPEYHLISSKANAFLVYSFFFHSSLFGYSKIFLYIISVSIIITSTEKIILLIKRKMNPKIKSIFQIR